MAQRRKRGSYGWVLVLLILVAAVAAITVYFQNYNLTVLDPKGIVGQKQKNLFIVGLLLSAIVVIPVFIMTTVIAYKYRETNTKASYRPEWDGSRFFETLWWGIPFIIIGVLSVITWNSSHALEPSKALSSPVKPIQIQVIALDWKWLFIYPKQNIATVNYMQIPLNTPVSFEITSDSVMNSFWIPQLGSQIYAMPGMSTHLNLMAGQAGDFRGSSANISGSGFAGMNFMARASSEPAFNAWVRQASRSLNPLSESGYSSLARPSKYNPPAFYSSVSAGLFDSVITKYRQPASGQTAPHGNGMHQ